MKALVFGADGQVGFELLGALGCVADVVGCVFPDVDFEKPAQVRAAIEAARPDVVVNAAAYTDVDGAERDPARAARINAEAVALLGEEAKRRRIALVHYSTDFVFDGAKGSAYVESDAPAPLSSYGRTKLDGERALVELGAPAIVFRTAWVYSLRAKSFVTAILRAAREREELRVVSDQVGNPTFCRDLAQATAAIVHAFRQAPFERFDDAKGVYHLAGTGEVSRFDFARAILELDPRKADHRVKNVVPIRTEEYPLPAKRPLHSALDCGEAERRFGVRLPAWRGSLARGMVA